jgi:DNA polymerase I-like protein with 3'-5' exonuclease and polymerase domains
MGKTKEAITILDNHYRMQQYESSQILSNVSEEIEASFIYLGLSDEQETQLQSIVKKSEEKMAQLFHQVSVIDKKFNHILSKMENTIEGFSITDETINEEENDLETVTLF